MPAAMGCMTPVFSAVAMSSGKRLASATLGGARSIAGSWQDAHRALNNVSPWATTAAAAAAESVPAGRSALSLGGAPGAVAVGAKKNPVFRRIPPPNTYLFGQSPGTQLHRRGTRTRRAAE